MIIASAASRQPAGSLVADAELAGAIGVPFGRVGGGEQVSLRYQVGVDVVVGQALYSSGPVTPSTWNRPSAS